MKCALFLQQLIHCFRHSVKQKLFLLTIFILRFQHEAFCSSDLTAKCFHFLQTFASHDLGRLGALQKVCYKESSQMVAIESDDCDSN